jgi:fibrillarin-like pre-rRNA processing protein
MEKLDPNKSKWKAAIERGLDLSLKGDENILYLGASSGTTVKELSKETKGTIFAVEKSYQMAIPLVKLAQSRNNIAPLFCDAQDITYLQEKIGNFGIDIIFCDIPTMNPVDIIKRASSLAKIETKIYFVLKTQSIRQDDPKKIFKEVSKKLELDFNILESTYLEPFHKKHYIFVLRKKG